MVCTRAGPIFFFFDFQSWPQGPDAAAVEPAGWESTATAPRRGHRWCMSSGDVLIRWKGTGVSAGVLAQPPSTVRHCGSTRVPDPVGLTSQFWVTTAEAGANNGRWFSMESSSRRRSAPSCSARGQTASGFFLHLSLSQISPPVLDLAIQENLPIH